MVSVIKRPLDPILVCRRLATNLWRLHESSFRIILSPACVRVLIGSRQRLFFCRQSGREVDASVLSGSSQNVCKIIIMPVNSENYNHKKCASLT